MQLPQTPLELIASQIDWAHKNINNNLDFVPDDKLNWKPAPESKSVLEIINHATDTVNTFTSAIGGTTKIDLPQATDRESAKTLVTRVVQAHHEALNALTPPDLGQTVTTPVGELPKGIAAGLPVVELINHHGQITYIQSLLGDSDSHLIVS
ncbi:MAG TPA: DinB family protein [Abditibacteriaceae bacterium]|jgi:uncharacterized damage-inducible protein DinB